VQARRGLTDGNLTALHMRLSGSRSRFGSSGSHSGAKGRDPLSFQGVFESGEHSFSYTVPNLLIDHAMRNTQCRPASGARHVNQNAVFIECFMDELAEAAGQDALRIQAQAYGETSRNLGVLNAVSERIGWSKPAPSGVYRGLAHLHCFDSFVAAASEISVKDGNKVKVHRIVAATDPGYAVNPAQIERQVAGSFVYGLSALFMQECTVKDGRIEQTNFHQYHSMRIGADAEGGDHPDADRANRVGRNRRADDLRRGAPRC